MNFAQKVKNLLHDLLNNKNPKITFKGKVDPNVVKQFTTTILKEKEVIVLASEYEIDAPIVVRNRQQLDAEIEKFEKMSGIKWPL